jgi:type I restriction enzyme S subunit
MKTRINKHNSIEQLQPKLRFPEFLNKTKWNVKKLGEISSKVTLKNSKLEVKIVLTNSAINGIVSQSDYFDKEIANTNNINGYYVIDIDDFVYNPRISNYALVGSLKRNKLVKGVISPLYTSFKFTEGNLTFFEFYFESKHWHDYMKGIANSGARHDRLNITNETFYSLPIPLPNIEEQTKIATFLSAVDEKLNLLKEKKQALEDYKKGMMQKIFSQEIRFKDENGKDFADWEEKSLGEIGHTFNGLTGKTKENFGQGKPYIQYKQIFDNSKIDINKCELVEINKNENQNAVKYGDVFFTISSETPNEIGTASVLLEVVEEMYLNSFCFGYRVNSKDELTPEFSRYLFRNKLFRNEIVKLAQGSTRFNMSKVELMKLNISIPCKSEQTKIANFLSAIDKKIALVSEQIEASTEYKKGLLQQLFC